VSELSAMGDLFRSLRFLDAVDVRAKEFIHRIAVISWNCC
jgi:hypothetical protein